jgi:hypothetical protein
VESYAARFHEKDGQPLAIMVFDWRGVLCEARYTHPDAENMFLDELRARARECLKNGRDTTTDVDAENLICQAVLLRNRKSLHGVVVVAGYGSKNGVLAQFGRDYFFGHKHRPLKENADGKA